MPWLKPYNSIDNWQGTEGGGWMKCWQLDFNAWWSGHNRHTTYVRTYRHGLVRPHCPNGRTGCGRSIAEGDLVGEAAKHFAHSSAGGGDSRKQSRLSDQILRVALIPGGPFVVKKTPLWFDLVTVNPGECRVQVDPAGAITALRRNCHSRITTVRLTIQQLVSTFLEEHFELFEIWTSCPQY